MATTTQPVDDIRQALHDINHHIRVVRIWSGQSRWAVQVYVKSRKVGPLLLPPEGGTVADVLDMLDGLISGAWV